MKVLILLGFLIPIYLQCSHNNHQHYGTHGHHHREHSDLRNPADVLVLHVYKDETNAPAHSPIARPRTPQVSPAPIGPEIEIVVPTVEARTDFQQPPTPVADRTKVKLAVIGLTSSIISAGITSLIVWSSTRCDK